MTSKKRGKSGLGRGIIETAWSGQLQSSTMGRSASGALPMTLALAKSGIGWPHDNPTTRHPHTPSSSSSFPEQPLVGWAV